MATQILHMLRKCYRFKTISQKNVRCFSTAAFNFLTKAEPFLTSKPNPVEHSVEDVGLYYTIDNKTILNVLFKGKNVLLQDVVEECKTFQETPLLIRKPAVEIINCLNNTNFERPINKYILYGAYGHGKTHTILHIIHYAYLLDWIIVHVPLVNTWECSKTDRTASLKLEGYIDLPSIGSSWLMYFKNQNVKLINKLDLRLQNDYKWNIQEENKKGDSLLSFIDHGIARGKYSCDVIIGLANELKQLSKSGKIKTLVVIDGVNRMFRDIPRSRRVSFKFLSANKISAFVGFKSLLQADWHNGAAVLSCSGRFKSNDITEFLPLNQLGLEGFEFLSPFIPIEVPPLTNKEMLSMLAYYRSKNWLGSDKGHKELILLSAGNPYLMKKLCGYL